MESSRFSWRIHPLVTVSVATFKMALDFKQQHQGLDSGFQSGFRPPAASALGVGKHSYFGHQKNFWQSTAAVFLFALCLSVCLSPSLSLSVSLSVCLSLHMSLNLYQKHKTLMPKVGHQKFKIQFLPWRQVCSVQMCKHRKQTRARISFSQIVL